MVTVPLAAETIFHLGSFPVTNALINAVVASLILIVVSFFIRRSIKMIPKRGQGFVELILESVLGYFDKVTNDRKKSRQFLPFVGTLFFFILLSNWMGLIPGTGSIGVWEMKEGVRELIPIFRPANSDLNLTLAMALLSVVASHVIGIITLGFFAHANKFIQLGTMWKALRSLNPVKILVAVFELVVGIIELFGEFAKIASLSLRLFGNIFAGEVLMTVIGSLIAFLVPLPFMAIEIIVGLVQATVFSMLTLVYLTVATMHPHGDDEHKEHEETHANKTALAH